MRKIAVVESSHLHSVVWQWLQTGEAEPPVDVLAAQFRPSPQAEPLSAEQMTRLAEQSGASVTMTAEQSGPLLTYNDRASPLFARRRQTTVVLA